MTTFSQIQWKSFNHLNGHALRCSITTDGCSSYAYKVLDDLLDQWELEV